MPQRSASNLLSIAAKVVAQHFTGDQFILRLLQSSFQLLQDIATDNWRHLASCIQLLSDM